MAIENLVFSGGGFAGMIIHGAFFHLLSQKYFDINKIKRIYGTSVGSLLAAMYCLKIDKEILDDYIIKRHWNKTFNFEVDIFSNKSNKFGFFNIEHIIEETLTPLLTYINISKDCTLKELYEKTSIEIFLYTVDIITFEEICLSYKTFPDLKLIKAVSMSCSVPIIFQPVCINEKYYVDGGLLNNYPLHNCIDDIKRENSNKENDNCDDDILSQILSFHVNWNYETVTIKNMNFIDYLFFLIKKLLFKFFSIQNYIKINNEILISIKDSLAFNGFNLLDSNEEKEKLINKGIEYAKTFLSNLK